MKLFTLFLTLLASYSVQADSFTIIRDGKEYRCEQTGPISPVDPIACANKAYSGPFSREESQQLCSGARDTSPADCGIKAYSGPYSRAEAVQLCTGSRTASGPIDCANKAYTGVFSRAESITLCQGNGSVANADCALKAYPGPYSREESIRMCKAQPLLVMRSLDLIAKSQELKPKVEAIKAGLQAKENLK